MRDCEGLGFPAAAGDTGKQTNNTCLSSKGTEPGDFASPFLGLRGAPGEMGSGRDRSKCRPGRSVMEGDANELLGVHCGEGLKFHLREPQRSDGAARPPWGGVRLPIL